MADTVELNAGSGGAICATDDVAGVHYQVVKLDVGADGASAPVGNANPIPVSDAGGSLTVDGTVAVTNAGLTALNGAIAGTEVQADIVSSALPSGAATSAKQDTIIGHVDGIEGLLTTIDADTSNLSVVGGGTEAAAIRVTLASDSTGLISIDDNGGSITVDVGTALPAGTNNIGDIDVLSVVPGTGATNLGKAEDGAHTTGDVGVMMLAVRQDSQVSFGADGDYVPLSIDASGAVRVTGGGGGTEYTEDVAAAADPVGTATILVRKDTPAATVSADGDNIAQRGTDYGAAYVTLLDTSGNPVAVGGGTQYTEDAAAAANPVGTALIGVRADALTGVTSADGDNVAARMTDKGELYVKHVDALTVSSHAVTNAGTFAVQESGSALTALQLIDNIVHTEDEASSDGHSGAVVLFRRTASPANTSGADLDYEVPQMSAGRVWTSATIDAALPAGTNNIGDVDVLTLPNVTLAAGTNTNEVVGDIAHDTGVSGNPVQVAGAAQDMDDTAPPNRVSAESDVTRIATDRDGGVFVHPHGPQIWSYHVNGSSALTDTTVHAAPGAGLSLYVTDIVISSGAATAMNAFFEEGSTTVLGPYYLEAVAGRGLCLHLQTPKKITANTALTITTSAAIAHAVDVTGFVAAG